MAFKVVPYEEEKPQFKIVPVEEEKKVRIGDVSPEEELWRLGVPSPSYEPIEIAARLGIGAAGWMAGEVAGLGDALYKGFIDKGYSKGEARTKGNETAEKIQEKALELSEYLLPLSEEGKQAEEFWVNKPIEIGLTPARKASEWVAKKLEKHPDLQPWAEWMTRIGLELATFKAAHVATKGKGVKPKIEEAPTKPSPIELTESMVTPDSPGYHVRSGADLHPQPPELAPTGGREVRSGGFVIEPWEKMPEPEPAPSYIKHEATFKRGDVPLPGRGSPYDRPYEEGVGRKIREGEEPGRAVQEPVGGGETASAGGILQEERKVVSTPPGGWEKWMQPSFEERLKAYAETKKEQKVSEGQKRATKEDLAQTLEKEADVVELGAGVNPVKELAKLLRSEDETLSKRAAKHAAKSMMLAREHKERFRPTSNTRLHEAVSSYILDPKRDVNTYFSRLELPSKEQIADIALKFEDKKDIGMGAGNRSLDLDRMTRDMGGGGYTKNPGYDFIKTPIQDAYTAQAIYEYQRMEVGDSILHRGNLYKNRKRREAIAKIADILTPERREMTMAELLKENPGRESKFAQNRFTVKEVLNGLPLRIREDVLTAAKQISSAMEETLRDSNLSRNKRGRAPIAFHEGGYTPKLPNRGWLRRKLGLPGEYPGLEIMPLDSYIHLPDPTNPRAKARHPQADYPREWDIAHLYRNHTQNMAREMFRAPMADYLGQLSRELKESKPRTSAALREYIDEALIGQSPFITREFDKAGRKVKMARGIAQSISRGLKKSVFAFRPAFILVRQPSSLALTFSRYGTQNVVKGLTTMWLPKNWHRANESYHLRTKKMMGGVLETQEGIRQTGSVRNLEAFDTRGFVGRLADATVSSMEEVLSRLSYEAAHHDGKNRLNLKGRELHEYASQGVGFTQSMYNYENVPGILRNKEITTLFPFQTFYWEMVNNIRDRGWRTPKDAALAGRRFRAIIEFVAAAEMFNMISREVRGDESYDWKHPWTYIPIAGTFIGESRTSRWARGFVPVQVKYADDMWNAFKDVYEKGDWRNMIKWVTRYHIKAGTQIGDSLLGTIAAIKGGWYDRAGRKLFPVKGDDEMLRAFLFGPHKTKAGIEYHKKRMGEKQKKKIRLKFGD